MSSAQQITKNSNAVVETDDLLLLESQQLDCSRIRPEEFVPHGSRHLKQLTLRHCGFICPAEAELQQGSQHAMDTLHAGWGVLLQHPDLMNDSRLTTTLMRVSAGMRSTIDAVCAGTMCAQLDFAKVYPNIMEPALARLQSFARFLPRHASLFAELKFCLEELDDPHKEHFGAVLARAVCEAGDSLCCLQESSIYGVPVLRQVAALSSCRNSLTSLTLWLPDGWAATQAQCAVDALRCLTALEYFQIERVGDKNMNVLLPSVSGLTRLTELNAAFTRHGDLRQLPTSLVSLNMGAAKADTDPPVDDDEDRTTSSLDNTVLALPPKRRGTDTRFTLQLGHLTALTWLDLADEADMHDEWEFVCAGDQLPPNVEYVACAVKHGAAVAALTACTALTQLWLAHDNTTADHLLVLTALKSLELVELFEIDITNEGNLVGCPERWCAAVSQLPIRELALTAVFTAQVFEDLARATRLTQLRISCVAEDDDMSPVASVQELAAALRPLRNLRSLTLTNPSQLRIWDVALAGPNLNLGFTPVLTEAVGSLTSLHWLSISGISIEGSAVNSFTQLQSLTGLCVERCDLDDYCLNIIALHLTGLQTLSLEHNKNIKNAALPTVAHNLTQLQNLYLSHTTVNDTGVAWLRQLPHLTQISLAGCAISDPELKAWAVRLK